MNEINSIDLELPKDKAPTPLSGLNYRPRSVSTLVGSEYAVGSSEEGQKVYYKEDLGLFPSVYEAWKNHWNLRTTPEDWWFFVACRIAKAVDKAAKKDSDGKVRELFVNHSGKEHICVDVDVYYIDEVEYGSFFNQMAAEITQRIKVPGTLNVKGHESFEDNIFGLY